jgi:hypothetical protein
MGRRPKFFAFLLNVKSKSVKESSASGIADEEFARRYPAAIKFIEKEQERQRRGRGGFS